MKAALIMILLTTYVGSAYAQKERPTKCLYTSGGGRKGVSTGSRQYFELCSELDPAAKKPVNGVCIFDRTWKRGNWNPNLVGRARFTITRECDMGVEFTTTSEAALPQGPMLWQPTHVTKSAKGTVADKIFTSKLDSENEQLRETKSPAVCFLRNDTTTLASSDGKTCGVDITAPGYCELKQLNNHAIAGKEISGKWWVQYTNVSTRAFNVCVGGVTLVDKRPEDPVYRTVDNIPGEKAGLARFCIRGTPQKEYLCTASGLNGCKWKATPAAYTELRKQMWEYIKTKYPDDQTLPGTGKFKNGEKFNKDIPESRVNLQYFLTWETEDSADLAKYNEEMVKFNSTQRWIQETSATVTSNCTKVIVEVVD